jgi:ATP-binding cassette, subfamily B, bacterial PglK
VKPLPDYLGLLSPASRRRLAGLCALAAAAGLLETLSVASIAPFLSALARRDAAGDSMLAALSRYVAVADHTELLMLLGAVVLFLLVAANSASAVTTWLMLRFANREGHNLSVRLLHDYLHQPYSFYLGRNVSELQKNIFGETQKVTNAVLIPGVQLAAKLPVIVLIAALLFYVNPFLALLVSVVLVVGYVLVFRGLRPVLQSVSGGSVHAGTLRSKHALDALTGVKEIKLAASEQLFLERFARPSLEWADAQAKAQTLAHVPRYAIETVALALILVAAIYLLGTSRDLAGALPVLGLYTFAGYRIMPALQQVFAAWASFRYARAAVDVLVADLAGTRARQPSIAAAQVVELSRSISFAGVGFRYPGAEAWALREVSLTITKNSTIGIVGATGSGKTTLIDIAMGLFTPQEGSVLVDDTRIDEANARAWQRNLGHVPQHIFLSDDSIARNIALGLAEDRIDWARVEEASRLARLHDFVAALPQGYRTRIGDRGIRLSGGQRQRIGIARALYRDPAVLVFDEATSALDNATESALLESLQGLAGRKTMVIIAHRLSTVRACERIYVMDRGRVVESGTYDELLAQGHRFRQLAMPSA